MHGRCLVLAVCCAWSVACAHAIVRPTTLPPASAAEALLVLPGIGYSREGERAFRALAPAMAAEGLDLYLPTVVARTGLEASRARLRRFVLEQRLAGYARVHVFAFIAGGWTLNPIADEELLPNLSTVVFDRSPYQERAPRVARERLRVLTWLRHGPIVFDLARAGYPPLTWPGVRVGLVVETKPTRFIERFAAAAARQGSYDFACDALAQPHDDCIYVAMSHGELYARFDELWPDVRTFIRTGRFSAAADRTPPEGGTR